jgi:hypothetical protein
MRYTPALLGLVGSIAMNGAPAAAAPPTQTDQQRVQYDSAAVGIRDLTLLRQLPVAWAC